MEKVDLANIAKGFALMLMLALILLTMVTVFRLATAGHNHLELSFWEFMFRWWFLPSFSGLMVGAIFVAIVKKLKL